uniref:Uncharacterized protein n=1 Tax=Rhizophora mucronata TaxID=61149 RepID=A0A2P2PST0_RHIMU
MNIVPYQQNQTYVCKPLAHLYPYKQKVKVSFLLHFRIFTFYACIASSSSCYARGT